MGTLANCWLRSNTTWFWSYHFRVESPILSDQYPNIWPAGPPADEAAELLRSQRRLARAMRLATRVDIGPRPEIDAGPVIHAANHRSLADLLLSAITFSSWGWPIRPLVAGSYFEKPVVAQLLKSLRCIPVHGPEALDQAAEELAKGWSVAIMPEGRVVPEAEWAESGVGRAHSGIGRLAIHTRLPVVANGASGTELLWPKGRPFPKIRPWHRQRLVLRSEVVGVIAEGRSREVTESIMAAIARCVNAADRITGRIP